MMKISGIEKNNKHPNMLRVQLDGEYGFSVPEKLWEALHHEEGQELSEESLRAIEGHVVRAARERAVFLLTAKDRTARELQERLEEDGYDPSPVEAAIEYLKTIRYVDDERYAKRYITNRVVNKAQSQRAIRYELAQKGVEGEWVDRAFADLEVDDTDVAYRVTRKKFGKYDWTDEAVRKKISTFLLHRGYLYGTIRKVLARLDAEKAAE